MTAYRWYFILLIAPAFALLSGCEAILAGSLLTSAAAVNELDRYSLPELKEIDHIELQKYESTPSPAATESFKDPLAVARIVQIFNDNRHFWKKEFRITPWNPYIHPGRYYLSVYSKQMLIRVYTFEKKVLTTKNEAGTIVRELSDADADSLSRVMANVNNQLLYIPYSR